MKKNVKLYILEQVISGPNQFRFDWKLIKMVIWIRKLGLDFRNQSFSHSLLYVALSRTTNPKNLTVTSLGWKSVLPGKRKRGLQRARRIHSREVWRIYLTTIGPGDLWTTISLLYSQIFLFLGWYLQCILRLTCVHSNTTTLPCNGPNDDNRTLQIVFLNPKLWFWRWIVHRSNTEISTFSKIHS